MKVVDNSTEQFTLSMLDNISSIIVKKYIRCQYISPDDFDDYAQTLRTRYLANKEKIEGKFKGDSQPKTYMSAVLMNMMKEELRSSTKYKKRTAEFEKVAVKQGDEDNSISPENRTVIENEKKHLQRVFLTLGKERAKILMCCKMVFKIKVTDKDFEEYLDGRPSNGAENYLTFSEDDQSKDIYQKLCMITNLVENKENKSDAIRLWLNKKIEEKRLPRRNCNHVSKYDMETFGILLEATYY